jgi:hypothetical protein
VTRSRRERVDAVAHLEAGGLSSVLHGTDQVAGESPPLRAPRWSAVSSGTAHPARER